MVQGESQSHSILSLSPCSLQYCTTSGPTEEDWLAKIFYARYWNMIPNFHFIGKTQNKSLIFFFFSIYCQGEQAFPIKWKEYWSSEKEKLVIFKFLSFRFKFLNKLKQEIDYLKYPQWALENWLNFNKETSATSWYRGISWTVRR